MSKRDFISGSILEFKIPQELGFGYCKILDFRSIREIDGVLAKVFDYIVGTPLTDITLLREKDWLFGARRLSGLPNTRGKGAWKFKGVLISEDDTIIPDFRDSPKSSPLIEDESTIHDWFAIKNLTSRSKGCHYDQVKHLENTVINTQQTIEIRTAMEIYRQNGKDPKDYFDLEDLSNWNTYHSLINVPIYKTIPRQIRGKALC